MRLSRYLSRLLAAAALIGLSLPGAARADSTKASSSGKGIVGGVLLGSEAVLLTEAAIDVQPDWLYLVGGGVGAVGGGIGGYYLESELSPKSNMFLLAGGMLLIIPTTVAVLSATSYDATERSTADTPINELPAEPAAPVSEAREETEPPPPLAPPASPDAVTPDTAPATSPAPTAPSTTPVPAPSTVTPTSPTETPPAAAPSAPQARRMNPRSRAARHGAAFRLSPAEQVASLSLIGASPRHGVHVGIPAVEVRNTYSPQEMAEFGVEQRAEVRLSLLGLAF
jgi:hypothetical protein